MNIEWQEFTLPNWAGHTARIDPYWVWARATVYRHFVGGVGNRRTQEPELSVLLDLGDHTAAQFAAFIYKDPNLFADIRIADAYRRPTPSLEAVTFCTASVSSRFFEIVDSHLWEWVRAWELCVPISASIGDDKIRPSGHSAPFLPADPRAPILGIVDDALPYLHARLRDQSRRLSRIHAVWLQDVVPRPSRFVPDGFDSGTELNAKEINASLSTSPDQLDESLQYQSDGQRGLRRRWSHGAAVLDIAAGSADGQGPTVIGVQLPQSTSADTSGASLSSRVLDAMHYICSTAVAKNSTGSLEPLATVVNLSYGRQAGPHDGSSMLERALDQILKLRNAVAPTALVLPAGNSNLAQCHARIRIANGATQCLEWRIHPDDHTPSFLELWLDQPDMADALQVVIEPPVGPKSPGIKVNQIQRLNDRLYQAALDKAAGKPEDAESSTAHYPYPLCVANFAQSHSAGHRPMFLIAVSPTQQFSEAFARAPAGLWKIHLSAQGQDVSASAWVQRDDQFPGTRQFGRQSRIEDRQFVRFDARGALNDALPQQSKAPTPGVHVQFEGTLNQIATGQYPVVVAGYRRDDSRIARYSSTGVAQPSAHSPTVAAPSDESVNAVGLLAAGSISGTSTRTNGTSMAAPRVARQLIDALQAPQTINWRNKPEWARQLFMVGQPIGKLPRPYPENRAQTRLKPIRASDRDSDSRQRELAGPKPEIP